MLKLLMDRILSEGRALSDSVLKVDGFLNHQVDADLMQEVGKDFYEYFKDYGITRVLTIESSYGHSQKTDIQDSEWRCLPDEYQVFYKRYKLQK